MDKVSKQKRSEVMSKIRSKETKLENLIRKRLWSEGIRYRKNSTKHFGKPDLIIAKKRIVIFIDSCFWHGCKKHLRLPVTNKDYWKTKISRNINRDKIVNKYYAEIRWKVIRIWEHDIKNDKLLEKVIENLNK